jgi:hypothetical protein
MQKELLSASPSLPTRKGKRPITIRGPLHVQCTNHGDDRLLRQLVEEVAAWPGIEPNPLPVGSADLVSIRVGEDVAKRRSFCLHYRERVCKSSVRQANYLS